ncbi:MAG TPA: hypothetical protein VKB93_28725, partial [Thermoanaerobaculia bacterium]|nr:hypothetical protein [Thermoanaerobaculia bacterium]
PFRGRLDLGRVGVFGHSRGGFAAPHACLLDQRFDACLNLDGYRLTEAVMQNGIRQPYMHIEESTPWDPGETEPAAERAATFGRMRGGAYLVTVKGAKHASFSDAPLIAPDKYPGIAIDAKRALEITNAYVLAFFDRHVRGLRVNMPSFAEATLETYGRASH